MWPFRDDKSVNKDAFESAAAFYAVVRKDMREKANHNKRESHTLFYSTVLFTLAAPLFVTLGQGIWGKEVPAILSVLAAAATTWLQFRKPQRLWAIYRRAQRELEREKAAFDFHLDDYATDDSNIREKQLARKVSEISFKVHEQWEGLVPEPETLGSGIPVNSENKK